ncbi:hypothetical protein BpHYR1_054475 [Brachionus plicatilis]|uniref:Uncharacterized protein n=1 Tax=Brachionus plicatilis TaxID=10195 RepID=A0A3M7RPK3_BRAPC|nr:hypothetical protein BpHYR1_054475 [Brachionus plicatilis]
MDLKQIEMDLSLKLEIGQAADYLEFVQCVTEIKYRSKFEMVRNLGKLMLRSDLLARLVPFLGIRKFHSKTIHCKLIHSKVKFFIARLIFS